MNLSNEISSMTLEAECLDYSLDHILILRQLIPSMLLHIFISEFLHLERAFSACLYAKIEFVHPSREITFGQ